MKLLGILLVFVALALGVAFAAPKSTPKPSASATPTGYHVAERYAVGGEGGWDILTLDPASHRLYYGRGTRAQVFDTESGKVVGEVADTPGIHAVGLVPELGRGFTTNGRDSSITVFDTKTLKTLARIRLDAKGADAIVYEPVSKRVFAFNGGSDNAVAIDPAAMQVVGTVALGGRPEFPAVDGKGTVYVNLEDSSVVVAFDAAKLQVLRRWSIAPGEEPSGLAIDRDHHLLFSACSNKTMVVSDGEAGKVVATVPIGERPDGAEFDAAKMLAFSSNGDGTLTVVHEDAPDSFRVVANVETQRGARTMALDPTSHRIWLASASFGEPPAPTEEHPHPRPPMVPNSFVILRVDP